MRKSRILLVLLTLGQLTCNQAIMTAPSGSTITLFANPKVISSNGGVSVISALVIEQAGTVVADGTVVQFFTDLGEIPEQGKTNDGVVRVNFRANGRSGEATISAFSGGDAPAPAPSASPTPKGAAPVSAAASTLAAAEAKPVKVMIGNFAAKSLFVTADPPQITNPRGSSLIRATAFDESGNPLPGVPVFFEVNPPPAPTPTPTPKFNGQVNSYSLDSGGRPVFTDSNGQAFDTLRTQSTASSTVTVGVQVPTGSGTGISNSVSVSIVLP